MVRFPGTDLATLRRVASDGVARAADLRAAGVSTYATSLRCRPSGPWQRLLPGVVLMSGAAPTRRQWLRAALAYAGDGCVISGTDALVAHGIEASCSADVLVLIPPTRRAASRACLILERTTRVPDPVWLDGLPMAPVTRATIDAARRERDLARLHAILVNPVRAGVCTVAELLDELDAGGQRGTAAPRTLLRASKPRDGSASPELAGQVALDVPDMSAGAHRTQPPPFPVTVLDNPRKRLEGAFSATRPGTSGAPYVGHISHAQTLRRTHG